MVLRPTLKTDSRFRSEAQHLVILKLGAKVFNVQKAVLIKDSPYFDLALNGPVRKGQTQTIDLDDEVSAEDLAIYIEAAYCSYFNENFKLREEHLRSGVTTAHVPIRLWVLADRFSNGRLQTVAKEGMVWQLRNYNVEALESRYLDHSTPHNKFMDDIKWLQGMFKNCLAHGIPFEDAVAEAGAAMPFQFLHEVHDTLEPEFRSAVTKMFFKHCENRKLKRPRVGGESTPAKRKRPQSRAKVTIEE